MFFSDSANLQKFTNQFIGILAAVAIPAFDGFRKKARSGEAKTNLGALFTAQKAFFYEQNGFCSNLKAVGFDEPDGTRHYAVGFKAAGTTSAASAACPSSGTLAYDSTATTANKKSASDLDAACLTEEATPTTPEKFIACAEGETASTNSNWQIDQNKKIASQ